MKKWVKLTLMSVAVAFFAVLPHIIGLCDDEGYWVVIEKYYPIYMPIMCVWFSIEMYKQTGKILLPNLLFGICLTMGVSIMTEILLKSVDRSLADVAIVLIYKCPAFVCAVLAPVSALIYKHKETDS